MNLMPSSALVVVTFGFVGSACDFSFGVSPAGGVGVECFVFPELLSADAFKGSEGPSGAPGVLAG